MKITNKLNINPTVYKLACDGVRPLDNDNYSVTEILNPVREIILKHRHYDEITMDVSELIPALFGTATHKLFEDNNIVGESEIKLKLGNLTGICDLYHDKIVEDYKTTSTSKVIKQDFNDHLMQTKIYAYMILMTRHEQPHTIKINYLMKDWSKVMAVTKPNYPQSPLFVLEYKLKDSDYDEARSFVDNKLALLSKYAKTPDNELPECTDIEKWKEPDVWKVYAKEDSPRALKVFDHEPTPEESGGKIVRKVVGECKKCRYYCSCGKWCK